MDFHTGEEFLHELLHFLQSCQFSFPGSSCSECLTVSESLAARVLASFYQDCRAGIIVWIRFVFLILLVNLNIFSNFRDHFKILGIVFSHLLAKFSFHIKTVSETRTRSLLLVRALTPHLENKGQGKPWHLCLHYESAFFALGA